MNALYILVGVDGHMTSKDFKYVLLLLPETHVFSALNIHPKILMEQGKIYFMFNNFKPDNIVLPDRNSILFKAEIQLNKLGISREKCYKPYAKNKAGF